MSHKEARGTETPQGIDQTTSPLVPTPPAYPPTMGEIEEIFTNQKSKTVSLFASQSRKDKTPTI